MNSQGLPPVTNNSYPMWLRVIFVLGFPSAVASFLLAVITGFIQSPLTKSLEAQSNDHQALIQVISESKRDQVALLQLICLRLSKAENQKDCVSITSQAGSR